MVLRSMRAQAFCAAVLALAVGGAVRAAPGPEPERAFLASAAEIGRAMVETGRLAAQRGGAPEVRAVGNTVAEDWTAWLRDLERLAAKRVVTLPSTLDVEHQATLERLQAANGETFDAAYLEAVPADHEAAERLFEDAARSDDAEIQAFAAHALPQLRADRRSTGRLAVASDEARTTRPAGRSASRRVVAAFTSSSRRLPAGGR